MLKFRKRKEKMEFKDVLNPKSLFSEIFLELFSFVYVGNQKAVLFILENRRTFLFFFL